MAFQRLKDKIAIITGSSSGIGRAIALAYAKEGAFIACADLRTNPHRGDPGDTEFATHDLITEHGGRSIFVKTDVSVSSQMKELVEKTVEAFGRVDV